MSEDDDIRSLLVDTAQRIFRDHCSQRTVEAAKRDGWSPELWEIVQQAQLPLVSIPEEKCGAGGSVSDLAAVLRVAGRHSAPLPLAETGLLAAWMLAASGLNVPPGPLAAAFQRTEGELRLEPVADSWRLSGELKRVPWASIASRLVVLVRGGDCDRVATVDPGRCTIARGVNLAWEPRDDVRFERIALRADEVVHAGRGVTIEAFYRRGALARALLMAGALDRALERSIEHARTRVQFGRAIGRFQAIQQEIARFGAEVAAAAAAALSAAGEVERGDGELAVACAKIRVGEAAATGSAIAHQIHAAIGVTEEFALHHSTLRLQAWRSEYGSETYWGERLGQRILDAGAERLWPLLTDSA